MDQYLSNEGRQLFERIEAYKALEAEFMARTDALCEDTPVSECDCGKCPCKELCDRLHSENPFA